MRLTALTPMLGVADVQRSMDFYRDALGFECLKTFEHEGTLCWCALRTGGLSLGPSHLGGIELMLTRIEPFCAGPHDREGRKKLYFYFNPDDVISLHQTLSNKGFKVSALRVTVYHMKEFELEDPDGYQLWFGQDTDEPPTP